MPALKPLIAALSALALLVVPAPASATDDDTPDVSLKLTRSAAGPLPQGTRGVWDLEIRNDNPVARTIEFRTRLTSLGSGETADASILSRTAPPGISHAEIRLTPSQWLAATGPVKLEVFGSDNSSASTGFSLGSAPLTVPRFEDVTSAAGLTTTHHQGTICNGTHKAGAAWIDIEGDGDPDLYLPDQNGPARLFVNDGAGRFTDQAAARGARNDREGYAATAADIDNDGDQDLIVLNNGADRMLINDGSGHFTDRAQALGLADPRAGSSASFADFDADGRLDLYVARWGFCEHETYDRDTLYRQLPDGGFVDASHYLTNNAAISGRGFLAGWVDYDLDRDQDLYLANDYVFGQGRQPNALWRNDGASGAGWEFANVTAPSGLGYAMNSMGLAIGDYDRDLDPDIAISNMSENKLIRNDGSGSFFELAEAAGVDRPDQGLIRGPSSWEPHQSITWGLVFADLNNDSLLDLYIAAGEMFTERKQPNELYAGTQSGRFLDLSAPSGADDPDQGRGVAVADYDMDGRLDLYVVNRAGQPRLFRNVTPRAGSNWLELELEGTDSAADACGARVVIEAAGQQQAAWVDCGSTSLASSHDRAVHFGLGDASAVSSARIEWPAGGIQQLGRLDANQRLAVTEPEDLARPPGGGGAGSRTGPGPVRSCGIPKLRGFDFTGPVEARGVSCEKARRLVRRYLGKDRTRKASVAGWSCRSTRPDRRRGTIGCRAERGKLIRWRWSR